MSRSVSESTRLRRSIPATTRSIASSRSACSTASLPLAGGEEGRLVQDVREIGPREPRGPRRDDLEAHLRGEPDVAGVDPQDRLPAAHVRPIHEHLTIEAPGPKECRVQDLGPVRGRHDDDALGGVEPVHLDQELVERLLALVVAPDEAGRAGAALADGVQLVDEDDAGRLLLGLLEEIPHAGRPDADEHLDELRAREEEERDIRLPRDRPREERLAAARRSDDQDALRDAAAQPLVLLTDCAGSRRPRRAPSSPRRRPRRRRRSSSAPCGRRS